MLSAFLLVVLALGILQSSNARKSFVSGIIAAAGRKVTKKSSASVKSGKDGVAAKALKNRNASGLSESPRFLAKLLPHNDESFLIEFHSDNNDHSRQMEPVLERLEKDLQTKVRRVNISRRREFYGLMEAMGHDECGALPFYYNRRTAQAVCGATSYLNLKRWATGDLKHLFQDPPENMFEQEIDNSRKRKVGAGGFLQEKLVGGSSSGEGKGGKESTKRKKQTSESTPSSSPEESASSPTRSSNTKQPQGKKKSVRQLREEKSLKKKNRAVKREKV